MFKETINHLESRLHVSPKEFRVILFFFMLFMTGGMLLVWSNMKIVNSAYEYQKIKRENQDLTRENQLLVLEKESLESLYRVQDLAVNQIGMFAPESHQVITIFLK